MTSKTKILILVLAIAVMAGGVLVWQYWLVPEYEFPLIEFPLKSEKKVTITTNKTEYEQGEIVKLTVKNVRNESIYLLRVECTGGGELLYLKLEKQEFGIWKEQEFMNYPRPQYFACFYKCIEVKPGEDLDIPENKLEYYDSEKKTNLPLSPGRYRFKIKTGWQCRENVGLKETFTIYSNEFTIKEIVQPQEASCQSELAEKQARYLGLSCEEFNILEASVREYLYKKYSFTRKTDYGIRYERVETAIKGVPRESVVVDAFANFRTPPVVIRAAFYDGNAWVISEESSLEE